MRKEKWRFPFALDGTDGCGCFYAESAFNALVFLFKQVLKRPLGNVSAARSRKEPRVPVVLAREGREMGAL